MILANAPNTELKLLENPFDGSIAKALNGAPRRTAHRLHFLLPIDRGPREANASPERGVRILGGNTGQRSDHDSRHR